MPDFQRDITLSGGSNDPFVAPGDYDYWLYNAPTNGSVTINKAGKAPILISPGEVFVIHLSKGEEISLSGTAGQTVSIFDHADVKLIPAAKDILGKFQLIGVDGATVAAVKTTVGVVGDQALVIRFAGTQVVTISGTPTVNIGASNVVTFAAGAQIRVGIGGGTTLASGGALTAPSLGANISGSITLGNGTNYNIWCIVGISLGTPAAADIGNMVLQGVASGLQLSYGINSMGLHGPFWVAGTGQTINVAENLKGSTAGVVYSATVWAVPVP